MPLLAGSRFGPYEILSPLGAGGMGEVYRARDARLNRDVAIKILPPLVSADPDRLARFEREARTVAALNHPHICAVYDVGDAPNPDSRTPNPDPIHFLVMELVEGPTLADKLAQVSTFKTQGSALALEETLAIAAQIAEALEAAHERGIVHRDLKPANIKLTADGQVKVLDFGLAKAMDPAAADGLANSPTMMSPAMSMAGTILGTAAYMAPEQARGALVDKRADIWAFGVVLFEMLTGRQLFAGETVSDTLASVLRQDIDVSVLPKATPPAVTRLLRRCLERDPKMRLRDIGEARITLAHPEAVDAGRTDPASHLTAPAPRRDRLAWAVALVALAASAVLAIPATRYVRTGTLDAPEMRLQVNTPPADDPTSIALSPDGRHLVYSAIVDGKTQLWVRPLDSVTTQPLAGTEGGKFPFWSPDSRAIGFFADSQLKRIDAAGGPVQTIAPATSGLGGTWSQEGVILFASTFSGPISRVAASGGAPSAATRLTSASQSGHWSPQFLPDGRHFFYVSGSPGARGVYVGALDSPDGNRLADADGVAVYVNTPSGFVLFARQGTLVAQRFDAGTLKLAGDPVIVAEHVATSPGLGRIAASSAATGTIVYRMADAAALQLAWIDRAGKLLGTVGDPDTTSLTGLELSPDGTRVARDRIINGNADIWLIETARNIATRFTFDPGNDVLPLWSPDGSRIVFSSNRKGSFGLYEKSVTGGGAERLLLATPQKNVLAEDWSPDGRFLLYRVADATGRDLWVLPLVGPDGEGRKPFPVVQTEFEEREGQFSPDGKWIAYASNRSGRFEIYAQPFPGPGGTPQVSTAGGVQPRWRRDGKELFYIAPSGRMTAVSIAAAPDGQSLQIGQPVGLFASRIARGGTPGADKHAYAVSPDGQRFLIEQTTEQGAAPITVVLNWHASK